MRLWAIQLRILYRSGRLTIAEPQVIVEADSPDEARQEALQWFRMGSCDSLHLSVKIEVRAVVEIALENIWVFNDDRFRIASHNAQSRLSILAVARGT